MTDEASHDTIGQNEAPQAIGFEHPCRLVGECSLPGFSFEDTHDCRIEQPIRYPGRPEALRRMILYRDQPAFLRMLWRVKGPVAEYLTGGWHYGARWQRLDEAAAAGQPVLQGRCAHRQAWSTDYAEALDLSIAQVAPGYYRLFLWMALHVPGRGPAPVSAAGMSGILRIL